MFRPNRIGTPLIWGTTYNTSTAAWVPNSNANTVGQASGNVINAAPDTEFGSQMLTWTGATVNIPTGQKLALLHQFNVTTPKAGDVRGVELTADLDISISDASIITPIFGKLTAAGAGVLSSVATGIGVVRFSPVTPDTTATPAARWRTARYHNTQLLIRDATPVQLAGTYAHGFLIINPTAGNLGIDAFHAHATIRQLNDQQSIGYADTLR